METLKRNFQKKIEGGGIIRVARWVIRGVFGASGAVATIEINEAYQEKKKGEQSDATKQNGQ